MHAKKEDSQGRARIEDRGQAARLEPKSGRATVDARAEAVGTRDPIGTHERYVGKILHIQRRPRAVGAVSQQGRMKTV